MDNAQKYEMAQADAQYQRTATITATNDFNLGDNRDVIEESKQHVVRADQYMNHHSNKFNPTEES